MSPTNTLEVNAERLWTTIERSAEIGRFRDTGLRRLALSREDQQVRDLFVPEIKHRVLNVSLGEDQFLA